MRYLIIVYTMELDFEGLQREPIEIPHEDNLPFLEDLAGRGKLLLA